MLRGYGLSQLLLLSYVAYVALRPGLHASTCAHPRVRSDGPVVW